MRQGQMFVSMAVLLLAIAGGAGAGIAGGQETYDLLFRTGTLDDIPRDQALVYSRDVENAHLPDAAARDTGEIALRFESTDDRPEMAEMLFTQGEKHRHLGSFPASVGNPIIMYFTETVVRDMVETVGGSPFYVRNRVKESLVTPTEAVRVDIPWDGQTVSAQQIVLHPFEGDKNAGRMSGFDQMTLTVTMSEDVPGWYHSLVAEVPALDGRVMYLSEMQLAATEGAQ